MLLEKYNVRLQNPKCNPSSETVAATAEFDDDLTDLLPYLNARLGPGMYRPNVPFLRVKAGGKYVTIHPRMIVIGGLRDEAEASEMMELLKNTINAVSQERAEIQPSYDTIGEVKALDVFKLLPRTNCGECGRQSCLAFAGAVAMREADIEECRPLFSGGFEAQRSALLKLLGMGEEGLR